MTILPRRLATALAATSFLITAALAALPASAAEAEDHHAVTSPANDTRFGGRRLDMPTGLIVAHPERNATRRAFFGDLHVHTTYSFDAFAFGTLATPYDAYRYAKGEPIKHPSGYMVQLRHPLDFYAVTDHAMFLGAVRAAADTSTPFSKLPQNKGLHNLNAPDNMNLASLPARTKAFGTFLGDTLTGIASGKIDPEMVNDLERSAWQDIINAAEEFNAPGEFTTFVAFEYTTSSDDRGNLHRNVIFKDADRLPEIPYSRFHSQNPEDLWDWMDGLRAHGIEALAIPHNSNGSNGQMFKLVDWAGNPTDDSYAEQRLRNEPLVEITQIKGASETHPALSMNDEWADFEIMPYRIATTLPSEPHGSYVREALLNGIAMEDKGIANPYKFGFIGASDTHTAAASEDESNYFSKVGLLDGTATLRGSVPLSPEQVAAVEKAGRVNIKEVDGNKYASGAYETWGTAGVTGVWAEDNTREAIYAAYRRKETFATSGPRMKIRLFAGFDFDKSILGKRDMVEQAYVKGVAMGSDLFAEGKKAPAFIVWATQDTDSAKLQRLQIVKGWTENGENHEQVYDVVCSDGGKVNKRTHRCPDNGAKVNLEDCSITQGVGAAELQTVWKDPDYKPGQRAFYYARVLENPTCRWSTWDAVRAGVKPRSDLKKTIQERAWSSPIWLVPDEA
ncbi:MAG: DUF3604 domain-containing protein [Pseudomonadales bacterium]|nr:DUF3604 domain-containing protein [Pseudomonadales bacterium]